MRFNIRRKKEGKKEGERVKIKQKGKIFDALRIYYKFETITLFRIEIDHEEGGNRRKVGYLRSAR